MPVYQSIPRNKSFWILPAKKVGHWQAEHTIDESLPYLWGLCTCLSESLSMKTSLLANFKLKMLASIPPKIFCFGLLRASETPDLGLDRLWPKEVTKIVIRKLHN